VLEKNLNKVRYGVGLDAASASFKNRRMFMTDRYYGLDINLSALKEGIKNYKANNTFGILADMEKLDKLMDCSIDLLVSSNTLYHFPLEKRLKAINHLCRITAPKGLFLCDLLYDKEFQEAYNIIKSYFKNIKIVYYRNALSNFYEQIFIKNGDFIIKSIFGSRVVRLIAWLISRLEYLTCYKCFANKQALLICNNKNSIIKNKFDLNHLPVFEDGIYNLIKN